MNENVWEDKCKGRIEIEMILKSRQIQRAVFLILISSISSEDLRNILISVMLPLWKKIFKHQVFIPRTEEANAHIFILNELPTFYSLGSLKSWNLTGVSELN